MISHHAFREYYETSEYRGFRKIRQYFLKERGLKQITFSNGKKHIETKGRFVEQALVKAFKAIDAYYIQKDQEYIYIASH